VILTYVIADTDPAESSRFEATLRSITADARALDGCLANEWYRHPDVPGRYIVHGAFETAEHFQAYLQSAVVQRIGNELRPLLREKPRFRHYEAHVLEQSSR
jgi:quinol monooxygenase YgiN